MLVPHARHRPHRTRSTRRRCPGPLQHCCKRQVVLLARDPKMVALQPWSGGAEQRGGRRRRLERHPWLETARVAVTPTMRSQTRDGGSTCSGTGRSRGTNGALLVQVRLDASAIDRITCAAAAEITGSAAPPQPTLRRQPGSGRPLPPSTRSARFIFGFSMR